MILSEISTMTFNVHHGQEIFSLPGRKFKIIRVFYNIPQYHHSGKRRTNLKFHQLNGNTFFIPERDLPIHGSFITVKYKRILLEASLTNIKDGKVFTTREFH